MKKVYYEIIYTDHIMTDDGAFVRTSRTIGIVTDEDVAKDFCNSNSNYEYITHTFEVEDE